MTYQPGQRVRDMAGGALYVALRQDGDCLTVTGEAGVTSIPLDRVQLAEGDASEGDTAQFVAAAIRSALSCLHCAEAIGDLCTCVSSCGQPSCPRNEG